MFNLKFNNFISYFLIIPVLFITFVLSIYWLYSLGLGYAYFMLVYLLFLVVVYLFYKVEISFFLNYIFSFITIVYVIFTGTSFVNESFILFEVLFSWLLLCLLNKYFIKEQVLWHRLEQAFAKTDSKKIVMQQELLRKEEAMLGLKDKLNKYYNLSNALKFFADNLTEEEIEGFLKDVIQQFFSKSYVRIIKNTAMIEENPFIEWVSKQSSPLFLEDLMTDYRFSSDLFLKYDLKSLLLIPILADDDIYCFLEISNKKANCYSQEDMRLALIITDVVSLSLTTEMLITKKKQLVRIDSLTNIYNRRYFFDLYIEEFNRSLRYKLPLSILMIDIDLFKQYNDVHGHLYGDDVLKSVVDTMKFRLREIDIIGRYGGEEFVVVLSLPLESAYRKAEELRIAIEESTKVTVSIGVSSLRSFSNINMTEFLDMADQALYKAKRLGRNQVVCHN